MISEKVRPHHVERKAILYVRQSSAHQVLHNRESGALEPLGKSGPLSLLRCCSCLLRLIMRPAVFHFAAHKRAFIAP